MAMLLHLTDNSPEPMWAQIARQVRAKIVTGDLEEGSALPEIGAIAREHRLRPREVRRALEELAAEGLLKADRRDRFVVATISARQRRELAFRRLAEDPQERELSRQELVVARDIQRRLLPPALVVGEGYAIVSRSFPARYVGGDFYDVLQYADGSVGIIVADVAGKGFGASLVMASVKAMTPFIAAAHDVKDTLRELNHRLCLELGRAQFVALSCARVAPAAGIVEIANAGMPDPLVVRPGAAPIPLEVPGPRLPLGLREDVPYISFTTTLEPGARLLFFSDGIAEARLPSGDPLGYDGLANLVARIAAEKSGPEGAQVWLDTMLEEAQRATSPLVDDDWTAVLVELYRPGAV